MAIEEVKNYFSKYAIEDKILEFEVSSATVELAAKALNVSGSIIAKTLSFKKEDNCILVVCAGDVKIDNSKFKKKFGMKAKMLAPDEVLNMVGHVIGGVCPFGVNENIPVYLDESMKRFETVFPACGSSNSAIEFTCDELFKYSNALEWVDIRKVWVEFDLSTLRVAS